MPTSTAHRRRVSNPRRRHSSEQLKSITSYMNK